MHKDLKKYKILVVEDNPGDFLLVSDYLEEEIAAPQLFHAELFAEAKEIVKQSAIDITLLDLTLPDMQGEQLLREMMRLTPNTSVIILTGYTDLEFAKKSIALGISDYLIKDNLSATVLYKSIVYGLERNKYLEQIRASQKRYSDLFQLNPQPLWVYDLETLKFLAVNQAAIQQYGYSREEFLAMTIRDIRPPQEIPQLEKALQVPLQSKERDAQGDFTHQRKNGEKIRVDIRSNVIQYGNRRAEVVMAVDITERYMQTQAIKKQNERLKEIAWIQSHVVRAPLSRIMGLISLIEQQAVPENEEKDLLPLIISSSHELDEVIKEIVTKTRVET